MMKYQESNQELRKIMKNQEKERGEKVLILRAMLVGNMILNIILLLSITLIKKDVVKMIYIDISSSLSVLSDKVSGTLDSVFDLINVSIGSMVKVTNSTLNILTIMTVIVILIFIAEMFRIGYNKIKNISKHATYYRYKGNSYKLFKHLISADIPIGVYAAVIVFIEDIKAFMPNVNIFLLWLTISLAGIIFWNMKDWISGFKS